MNRSAPILKPVVSSALIADSVRRRRWRTLEGGGEVGEVAEADAAQTACSRRVRARHRERATEIALQEPDAPSKETLEMPYEDIEPFRSRRSDDARRANRQNSRRLLDWLHAGRAGRTPAR